MIKFFRKIRQQLLTENKFSKYLLYAIGEIILVVIGILIALNINNSNQQQINDVKITSILKEIQQDLVSDVERSKLIFDRFIRDQSIMYLIIDNKSTRDDYKSRNKIGHNLGGLYSDFDFVIHANGYDNLMRNIDNVPQKYQPILKDLKHLYVKIKTTTDVYNSRIIETVYKNVDDSFEYDWTVKFIKERGLISDEEINYYLNDPHYKKIVVKYMNARRNIFRISQEYRYKALETYIKIQELIESTDSIPLTLGLKPKTETFLNTIVGTYKIKDSTLAGWNKEIKISNEGKELHFIVEEDDVDFKLEHHKESIFILRGTPTYIIFNTPKEGDLFVTRYDLGNTTFSKEK